MLADLASSTASPTIDGRWRGSARSARLNSRRAVGSCCRCACAHITYIHQVNWHLMDMPHRLIHAKFPKQAWKCHCQGVQQKGCSKSAHPAQVSIYASSEHEERAETAALKWHALWHGRCARAHNLPSIHRAHQKGLRGCRRQVLTATTAMPVHRYSCQPLWLTHIQLPLISNIHNARSGAHLDLSPGCPERRVRSAVLAGALKQLARAIVVSRPPFQQRPRLP